MKLFFIPSKKIKKMENVITQIRHTINFICRNFIYIYIFFLNTNSKKQFLKEYIYIYLK